MPLFDAFNRKFGIFQNESDTKSGWAPIMGAVGIVFVTLAAPTIGRKKTFAVIASTFVVGWTLITYTKSCEVYDYFQVIVAGHAIVAFAIGATYPISSIYLVETIRPELFGILGVIPSIFFNGGTLLYNTIHDHFTYTHIAFFAAALHIIFFVLTLFLNESAPWLAAKKLKTERAKEKKTRQSEIDDRLTGTSEGESVLLEIECAQDTPAVTEWTSDNEAFVESEIKQTIDSDGSTTVMQENEERVDGNTAQNTELDLVKKASESTLFNLIKIPKFSLKDSFNPLVVVLQLIFLANYSGMSTIQLHMVKFHEAIDATKDENYVFRLIDQIKLGGSLVSLVMIVIVTRKNLLYFSFSTMAFSLMALGSYFFIKADNLEQSIAADYQWIPFVLSIVFIVGYSVGIGSIVWLVMADVLPETFRDILATVATSFHWICIYGIFILFKNNRGKSLLYTDVLFWMHGFICIYGIIFVKSCIPDSKGCSLDDLLGMLTAES
ncbi:facilitated trehalose transporter Tret1-like [Bradysia coprophila]|uniref:facilitated trehalose transporter Tret1-like n=1 Tax=Bradysia coprophila TaxID=38358 RepID=UPI00187D9B48|nr:facilitated trehalose transporter Tret1-like [Bradysia coprophila]